MWVNLSPYEKDRIVPQSFGQTEMGRDLLAEDYLLKQVTASLIYPEDEVGKKFWKRIYEEAQKKFSDEFKLPHGYWEAKDSADDLPREVKRKFEQGYPRSNILFQAPERIIIWGR